MKENIQCLPYKVIGKEGDEAFIELKPSLVAKPETLCGLLVKSALVSSQPIRSHFKDKLEAFLQERVNSVVLSIPSQFGHAQRKSLLSGIMETNPQLQVLQLVSHTAASIMAMKANDILKSPTNGEKKVLAFDLGAGKVDAMVVHYDPDPEGSIIEVLGHSGNTCLGGDHFTDRLVRFLFSKVQESTRIDIRGNIEATQRVWMACEEAKIKLSVQTEARISISNLLNDFSFEYVITRGLFEEVTSDLLSECLEHIKHALQVSKLDRDSIAEVYILGGSSAIPKLQASLEDFFGKGRISYGTASSNYPSIGATILGSSLLNLPECPNVLLLETTGVGFYLEDANGQFLPLLPRNTIFPTRKSIIYSNSGYDQSSLLLRVYEDKNPIASRGEDKKHLCDVWRCEYCFIRASVEITFGCDGSSILTVWAYDR